MRSTSVSSWARLVITADTCGISDMPANVAPPLKSTSTMFSCSGEWVRARPSTRVRRNSDLPEPVAPITRPWGPMPCWADSLMSRLITLPPSPRPMGTRSRSRAGRCRHARAGSKVNTSPRPSRSMKSIGPVISPLPVSETPAVTTCSGVSRRANASAVAWSHWSAFAFTGASRSRSALSGSRPSSAGWSDSNSSRRQEASSSSSQRAGRSSTVTPCRPSGGTTWLPGGRDPPSTTNSRCGVAGRSSAPKRGRSLRSGGSSAARSLREVDTIRIGPTASLCCDDSECGSHFIQSQCARFCSEASTAISRLSGDWNAAALQIIARASDRASSSGPHTSMRSKARRSIEAGRSGSSRCTTRSRCSADAAAGSTWSTTAVSGATRSRASGCAQRPYRTCRKWASEEWCSQTRERSSARAGSALGAGCCQVSARRCWSAASRATLRMLARYRRYSVREPVTCCVRCLRCRSIWTMMKPTVANRNMPAAR